MKTLLYSVAICVVSACPIHAAAVEAKLDTAVVGELPRLEDAKLEIFL